MWACDFGWRLAMAQSDQQHLSYRFDDVVVDRDLLRVLKRDQVKTLEPRAFELLIYLIEHRDHVTEKQELFDQVWKESFVSDNALTQEIRSIRHAIGDAADSPRYIRTFQRHGYRFIADVIEERRAVVSTESVPSIAVLPFVNLSAAPENEYFCDGLAEELLNALTRVSDLRVVARTSAFSFKHQQLDVREIGRRLNAAAVLEGSVQRTGNRVRILTQLINTADGYHLWSERFDREMDDIFTIQDEIAGAIIDRLKIKLLPNEQNAVIRRYTDNVDAYQLYLKGRHFWNKRYAPGALEKALEYFHQAIRVDSRYALAYSGVADCYNLLGLFQFRSPHKTFPSAMAAAERALEIDDTISEAHTSLAYTKLLYAWDWPGAERECKQALELNPGYAWGHLWYAHYLSAMARFGEAVDEVKRAQSCDPLSLAINANVGLVLHWARKHDQAVEQLEKTIELDPNFGLAYLYLAYPLVAQERYDGALAAFRRSIELTGRMPIAIAGLGYLYARMGVRDKAENVLRDIEALLHERHLSSCSVYAGLGDRDNFFTYMNRAYEERNPMLAYLKIIPEWDAMRSDPRFDKLLRRMGLAR
jgi:adenylate cyclase